MAQRIDLDVLLSSQSADMAIEKLFDSVLPDDTPLMEIGEFRLPG